MTDNLTPGSPEWHAENRRRTLAGEPPLAASMSNYRVLRPSYIHGAYVEGGSIVQMYDFEVNPATMHLEKVVEPEKSVAAPKPVAPKP